MPDTLVKLRDVMPEILKQLQAGGLVELAPRGTSMLPMIVQGRDSVILASAPGKLKKYDIPFYQRDDGQYVLHRIVKTGDTYTCIGDNQFAVETGVRHDQVIAVVVGFMHNGRKYSVDQPRYRIYCRFWHHTRRLRRLWRKAKRVLCRVLKK